MKNLIKKIQNTAFQNSLWAKGSRIVLGVSGGPDSVCLLDMMSKIAPKADLQLLIAHVNYGLRGKDSEKDEQFVRKLAEKYSLKIDILKVKNARANENELRDIRYNFFEKIRQENKFDLIAVAHNSDDQVETFLMRVIRGAGLLGLSAMKFKNEKIIRPLLNVSRKEILEYLNMTSPTYRTDRTNAQNLFLRNKIRNKLVPYLEKNFNPKIKSTILDATVSITDDLDLLEKLATEICKVLSTTKNSFSAKQLLAVHPAMQRRVIFRLICNQKPNLKNIESSHIEEVLKALKSTKGKNQIVSFRGLKLTRKGDKVTLVSK